MKCNICGNGVAENTTFCPYCGSAIKKQETSVEEIKIQTENVQTNVEPINEQVQIVKEDNLLGNQNINVMEDTKIVNEQPNVMENVQVNDVQAQEQINNNMNYNPNNMYNMQNYQSMDVQNGYNYNNVPNYEQNYINNNQVEDKTNIWLAILSWFIPLVGIILFFTMKNSSKKTSKACGIVALISILLSSAVLAFGAIALKNTINDLTNVDTTEEYDDYTSDIEEESNNIWESYKVTINGKEIILPCSYSEFVSSSNFKLKPEKETLTIKDNYYDIINVYSGDKVAAIINIYNRTGADALYKDSKVSSIEQSIFYVKNNKVDTIMFPGDLYVGKKITKDEVISLLGKPAKEGFNEYEDSKRYNLKYTTKETYTTSNYYEIVILDDVIQELKLDNRS